MLIVSAGHVSMASRAVVGSRFTVTSYGGFQFHSHNIILYSNRRNRPIANRSRAFGVFGHCVAVTGWGANAHARRTYNCICRTVATLNTLRSSRSNALSSSTSRGHMRISRVRRKQWFPPTPDERPLVGMVRTESKIETSSIDRLVYNNSINDY